MFSIVVESTDLQTQSVCKGKLSFVDLAGSEVRAWYHQQAGYSSEYFYQLRFTNALHNTAL